MNKLIKLILNSALLLVSSNVMALPMVTGGMEMGGSFIARDASGAPVDAANATFIDFDFFGFNKFIVNTAYGDFDGLADTYGDIKDFQFDPFVSPIAEFWKIDVFSFELTDVSRGFTNDPDNILVLNGSGIITSANFDDTAATWSFTGDTTGVGSFSWSATSAIDVPEPGLLFLLSIGLVGIGIRRKL